MATLKVWYETGYANCGKSDEIEVDDTEIEECENDEELEGLFEEYAREWFFGNCHYGFKLKE